MPGRIMEQHVRTNGSQTNYEKEKMLNGVNGSSNGIITSADKDKGRAESEVIMANSIEKMTPNGSSDDFLRDAAVQQTSGMESVPPDMLSQAPPELMHFSDGFIPLSKLLTRVSEQTHVAMGNTVKDLNRLPLPASAMNGNSARFHPGAEDNSQENVAKKKILLDFGQETHTKFTKALVLTRWSRRSEEVSKVIDLRMHLLNQSTVYENNFRRLVELRRGLGYMRVREPDLETAVEVLSTGKTSWFPDDGLIEPPPLTAKEILKTLKTLNSQLSLRIELYEHEKLPVYFKNYSIKSGRITFHVAGEFELDLTIADEDHRAQFWFIDFRFLFTPRISQIPEELLRHIEQRVNFILSQDDPFRNCYKYLHELVLTHKIAEIKRQAYNLNRNKWVGTLIMEPLQRALCIQYWHGRYPAGKGPKSWIIIGVYSGKRKVGRPDPDATPRIGIRWFRDGKEEKANIPIDLDCISTESLLKTVIGMHIEHILTSTFDKLLEVPLYKSRDLALESSMSPTEPIESIIKLQVTHNETLTVAIEPITGRITLSPASASNMHAVWGLNTKTMDPANDLCDLLMNFRPSLVKQEIVRKCISTGWENAPNPGIRLADLKGAVFRKDTQQVHWLKKPGWKSHWYVAIGISTRGEEWKLIETSGLKRPPPGPTKGRPAFEVSTAKVSRACSMPMMAVSPIPSYAFFGTLHIYAASQISHLIDVSTLHNACIKHKLEGSIASVNNTSLKMPRIFVQLESLLGFQCNNSPQQGQQSEGNVSVDPGVHLRAGSLLTESRPRNSLWAKDMICLTLSGVETLTKGKATEATQSINPESSPANGTPAANSAPSFRIQTPQPPSVAQDSQIAETCFVTTIASFVVPSCKDLDLLGQHIDDDIRFRAASGKFSIKVKTPLGQSSIPALSKRLRNIEQLVKNVKVLDDNKADFKCQSFSLSNIAFTYGPNPVVTSERAVEVEKGGDNHGISGVYRANIDVGSGPNVLSTIRFEDTNPHVRMEHAFNSTLRQTGLGPLFIALRITLGLATAFETIENSWCELSEKAKFYISVREPFRCHLVYQIRGSANGRMTKIVRIEIYLRVRGNQRKFVIRRVREGGDDRSEDDIDEALKDIWNKVGANVNQPWRGLNSSATCEVEDVRKLVFAVDNVIKNCVKQIGTSDAAPSKGEEIQPAKQNQKEPQALPATVGRGPAPLAPPQQPQRGIAPPAPMMANPSQMSQQQMSHQQMLARLAQMPEPERRIQMLRIQAEARLKREAQQQMQQRQQQQGAQAAPTQRRGQDHEVIMLDD